MNKITFTVLAIFLIPVLPVVNASSKNNPGLNQLKNNWGLELERFKQATGSYKTITSFRPVNRPRYKNKIIKFLTNIDSSIKNNMIVYRIQSNPVIDFVFINNTLQSTLEEWSDVNSDKIKQLQSTLAERYGEPTLQKKNNLLIYSYSSTTTKILFQVLLLPGNKNRCKIYYYNRKIFNILLNH